MFLPKYLSYRSAQLASARDVMAHPVVNGLSRSFTKMVGERVHLDMVRSGQRRTDAAESTACGRRSRGDGVPMPCSLGRYSRRSDGAADRGVIGINLPLNFT